MSKDRGSFARYQIFRYADELFTRVCDLSRDEDSLCALTNYPHHGLNQDELLMVLHQMFQQYELVAMKDDRGLFTPKLEELEKALRETPSHDLRNSNTWYGYTTGAMEAYRQLRTIYGDQE